MAVGLAGGRGLRQAAAPVFVAALGALIGAGSLDDNSFLTHLATGRLIVGGEGVPYADPYTFTALGDSWIAQSWFASLIYGVLDEIAGLDAIRVLTMLLCAAISLVAWRLTAAAGAPLARLLAWAPVLGVGLSQWNERPLLFGLLFLGLTLLAAEQGLDPRWLVAVGWLWLNTHGSWPLGLVALGTVALGRWLDRTSVEPVRRAATWLGVGLLVGIANPYGPRLLWFPLELLAKRESLSVVAEWKPPTFGNPGELAFLAVLALAVVALRRSGGWRAAVPLAVFAVVALLGARNLSVAAMVLLPGTALGLRDVRRLPASFGSREARTVLAAGVAMAAVAVARFGTEASFDGSRYPEQATDWLVEHDLAPADSRIVSHDIVGNYFEARFGAGAGAFIDDRIELIPTTVIDDYVELLRAGEDWQETLDRYAPDAVLWSSARPLTQLLRLDSSWQLAYEDDDYVVFVRG